jgi:hypothetical protein
MGRGAGLNSPTSRPQGLEENSGDHTRSWDCRQTVDRLPLHTARRLAFLDEVDAIYQHAGLAQFRINSAVISRRLTEDPAVIKTASDADIQRLTDVIVPDFQEQLIKLVTSPGGFTTAATIHC